MKLKRFLLRYYPPGLSFIVFSFHSNILFNFYIKKKQGIILEYEQQNVLKTKSIDLLDLNARLT